MNSQSQRQVVVCALYHFVSLDDYQALREPLLLQMQESQVKGTVLLASEGINGTIAGTRQGVDSLLAWLKKDPRLKDLDYKESFDDQIPFYRAKVKLKKEIVTMGVEGIDPKRKVGTHIKPANWNALLSDPDITLIDTRNQYEVEIGTFENAINPGTKSFREFPEYVKTHLDPNKHKKIAMFCTGGIRCEKSTAYLKENGFQEVYHLEGGILKYLEEIPEEDSLWKGECFVFDNRVAVTQNLEKGGYDQCHACRLPITEDDKQSDHYEKGVSCPRCYDNKSLDQKHRFREREKQMNLASERGEPHLGSEVSGLIQDRKLSKIEHKNRQQKNEETKDSASKKS